MSTHDRTWVDWLGDGELIEALGRSDRTLLVPWERGFVRLLLTGRYSRLTPQRRVAAKRILARVTANRSLGTIPDQTPF